MTAVSRTFVLAALILASNTPCAWAQMNTGSADPSVGPAQWDSSTLDTLYSESVDVSVVLAADGQIHVLPILTDESRASGNFHCMMTTADGTESLLFSGTVWSNGSVAFETTYANAADNMAYFMGANANSSAALRWRGFWSDYWYNLTNPSAMDDDLETGFYVAAGTAAVAGTAAGGLAIAGVDVVIWGGGAAAGGGTAGGAAAGGAAAGELGVGTTAVVAEGLGAGSYPALLINGTVYVGRFHEIAWQLAGRAEPIAKYGIAIIDATGKVIGWL